MEKTALTVSGVSKSFGAQKVLCDVSLPVQTGEVVGIRGRSGCGKSTLLKIVAGLVAQDHGLIYINGKEMSSIDTYHRGVAYVFQSSVELFPWLTPATLIGFAVKKFAKLNPGVRIDTASEVEWAADIARLPSSLLKKKVAYLSGGEKQRVSLARAVAERPRILLADEPLANLDVTLREELLRSMRELFDGHNMSVLYVSHDPNELCVIAHRQLQLVDGHLGEV